MVELDTPRTLRKGARKGEDEWIITNEHWEEDESESDDEGHEMNKKKAKD